jgi:PEP-CTERM/exosortase A-associated glycosyltransferase
METALAQTLATPTKCYQVLHVFDHSWPVLSGYSVRSRSLVRAQHLLGYKPQVLTGPLHQLDDPSGSDTEVDGLRYDRTPIGTYLSRRAIGGRWPFLREAAVVRLLRRRIVQLIDEMKPDIIHAHSPALCGLAAYQAAKSRNVPVVYEIRAFWEEGGVGQNKNLWSSIRYRLSRQLELQVSRKADAVVGIAKHILQDLQERGIASEKLFHVCNGVDVEYFAPQQHRDTELARQLGLDNALVFGFVGSLYRYEGISWFVRAMTELKRSGVDFNLLIVGDGEDLPEIARVVRELGLADCVRTVGRVPHDQVRRYYSVMDVMVYPRRKSRLTETVTPLKPLEAMALGKPILASDVGGIRELVEHEKTGLLFRAEDIQDFCRHARRLSEEEKLRRQLGERARQAAVQEKDWKVLVRRYERIYEFAIASHKNKKNLPCKPSL